MSVVAPAVAPPSTRPITREEILRLGGAGRPWDFLPIGLAAVQAQPTDAAVHFLLAVNFARLGLVTPAREQLAILPELGVPGDHRDTVALAAAMSAMPSDRIAAEQIVDTCRGNLEVLDFGSDIGDSRSETQTPKPKIDLWPDFDRWRLAQAGCEWFRTLNGNILRRRNSVWLGLADHQAAATEFMRQHAGIPGQYPMFIIEGVNPPWLLRELGQQEESRTGVRPTLIVVQADVQEFLDGLALADLAGILRQERVQIFLGPRASLDLSQWFSTRLAYKLGGPYIAQGVRRRCEPGVDQVIREAQQAQSREYATRLAEVRARYAGRDQAYWRQRYQQALGQADWQDTHATPLRIMIRTTRYSTYMQHSARDLLEALHAAGHHAELIIEPDTHTQLAPLSEVRFLGEFDPDLAIYINYMRAHTGEWIPPELPFVSWIQDSLVHQFRPELGLSYGPLDFLVGHLHTELFTEVGFSRQRALALPVMVSERKFHPGAVDPVLRRRMECDVAFVSHHSEPPKLMHARLITEAAAGRASARVMERLYPLVEHIALDAMGGEPLPRLREAVHSAVLVETGRQEPDHVITSLLRHYAVPLAERFFRHQTLEWTAEIAQRAGLTLKVFGRGWENHDRFAPFAAAPVEHGDELRTCYQCAGVHLHASLTTLTHQRVMECALSGGLPICRLTAALFEQVMQTAKRHAWLHSAPERQEPEAGKHAFIVADSPHLMQTMALRQRLGLEAVDIFWSGTANMERLQTLGGTPLGRRAEWLLGDLAELTFRTPQELEAIICRALDSPGWRAGWSSCIAARVRQRLTLRSMVEQVLALVQRSLAAVSSAGSPI